MVSKKAEDETLDTFYHGRIRMLQKKSGYRFSVDAPLLADFIRPRIEDELLELGAGNGVISLLISQKPFKRITVLEIQPSLAELAARNVRLNHLEGKIEVLNLDLRLYSPGNKFDGIFSNPPYYKRGRGHLSPSSEKSIARHEIECTISDVMRKSAELLKPGGRAWFVFSFRRHDDFLQAVSESGLDIILERRVIPYPGSEPNLFLSECGLGSHKTVELPPLILYDEDGRYSEESEQIFAGRTHD